MAYQRPRLAVEEACQVAAESFGIPDIDPSLCRELVGYDDQNWLIVCQDGSKYTLKIHNAAFNSQVDAYEAQNLVMQHLTQHGVACPEPLPCRSHAATHADTLACTQHTVLRHLPHCTQSQTHTQQPASDPQSPSLPAQNSQVGTRPVHLCRLLRWLPGKMLIDVPFGPALQEALGEFMGHACAALGSTRLPPLPALQVTHDWRQEQTLDTLDRNLPAASQILSEQQVALLCGFMEDWRHALLELHATLPSQVCHGDANERNVLVSEDGSQIVGLIDFGDMCYTWAAAEAAHTCLYAMLLAAEQQAQRAQQQAESPQRPGAAQEQDVVVVEAAFEAGRNVLAGFERQRPLTESEVQHLPLLVSARCCVSLTNGAATAVRDSSCDRDYVLSTQRFGWLVLRQLEVARKKEDADARTWLCKVPTVTW